MNPEPPKTEKTFAKDMKTFEQLPAKTKELELLRDRAEKATGKEGLALNKAIQIKSTQP